MDFGNFILKSVIKVVGIKERNNTEDIPLVREKIDYWSRFLRQPKNVYDEVVEFEKFKAEWLIPNEYDTDKVLLYFHGGGFSKMGSWRGNTPQVDCKNLQKSGVERFCGLLSSGA